MKIPKGYFDDADREQWNRTLNRWWEAADQLSMEYGMLVQVKVDVLTAGKNRTAGRYEVISPGCVTRLFFTMADKEFESLDELRRTIKNKAFL